MSRRVEIVIWVSTIALIAAAVGGWRSMGPRTAEARAPLAMAPDLAPAPAASRLGVFASRIVAHDPFRLERKPAAVAFGSIPLVSTASAAVGPRPTLVLSGVFGPPWQAVLEGIPERQGSVVVRVGDVFGALRIRSIRPDTIVVQSADTTWKLTVRRVW